jgi:glutamate-1-semialdehyde 2,1-aminomutase
MPDLTCLGKIIGGGLPVGAYGGRREIMEQVAPIGAIYQAGTLSGNPIAMAAGYTTLKLLEQDGIYEELERKSARLEAGFVECAKRRGIPLQINRVGSMFSAFFTEQRVMDYDAVQGANLQHFISYYKEMLALGILTAPTPYEVTFISTAHTDEDIDKTISAHDQALAKI